MSHPESISFFDHFENLKDPRIERSKLHKLVDIVFIAVCAVLGGANDFVGMETFGKDKRSWLKKYLELPNGIPSHDTFGRVFSLVPADQFTQCFLNWVQSFQEELKKPLINIDGKTLKASGDDTKGLKALHVVSAWASTNRLLLGQIATDQKSNEITAIPKLLAMLELRGAIVTIDAMGCQKAIATQIREKGGDYVLPVKDNQEHLHEDLIHHFEQTDRHARHEPDVYETEEKGHGREEYRCYETLPAPATLRNLDEWKDLRSICRVTRVRTEKSKTETKVHYYISSLAPKAKKMSEAIRGHWGIENGLHWILDMYFHEDQSRAHIGYAGINLAQLRRWVLTMLCQDTTMTNSIEKKRLRVAWDVEKLETILGLS